MTRLPLRGKVFLVGAGPGSPGLLTLRAYRLLRRADVVIYDRLVSRPVLRLAPKRAKMVYVGKGEEGCTSQEEINRMMAEEASKGLKVVRLKGGDPFLFGRGGEEAQYLRKRRVPFEVVPGVTSALSAPAYSGIPVTHRGLSSSVAVVTGHEDPKKLRGHVRWEKLASAVDTIVVMMGVGRLKQITRRLMKGGLSPSTSVAVIEWGTTKRQRTLLGKLGTIAEEAEEALVKAPSILVVGKVASLSKKLSWLREGAQKRE